MSDEPPEPTPVGGVSDADNAPPTDKAGTPPSASGDASYNQSFRQKALAYARLLRLSNGPTAVADVWMGYAVVAGSLEPTAPLVAATIASLLAYHGGMAQNDATDVAEDTADQRSRPLVLGDIAAKTAGNLAVAMLVASIVVAMWASHQAAVTCAVLFAAISLYNTRLKSTAFGPLLMAACRYLNVLLGVAAATFAADFINRSQYAFKGLPLYVIGLTCFARMETGTDRRIGLIASMLLSVAGLFCLAWIPTFYSGVSDSLGVSRSSTPPLIQTPTWYLLWTIVALIATRGMVAAILQPTPRNIGRGVGIAIQGLVVIDAVLAAVYAGPVAGLAILALLPVTMLLARWIPQT